MLKDKDDIFDLLSLSHPDYGKRKKFWKYFNENNELSFCTLQFEDGNSKTEIVPARYIENEARWDYSYPSGKLPLLNSERIQKTDEIYFCQDELICDNLKTFEKNDKGINIAVSVTSAGGGTHHFHKSDLSILKTSDIVYVFPKIGLSGKCFIANIAAYCIIHKINFKVLDIDKLNWKKGKDLTNYSKFDWYDKNFISSTKWIEKNSTSVDFSNSFIQVVAQLSNMDLDRKGKDFAKILGIGVSTLKREVKNYLKGKQQSVQDNGVISSKRTAEEDQVLRETIYNKIKHIAESTTILKDVIEFAQKDLGLVGEEDIITTTFLMLTSRLLDKPISVIVKGSSSSGKSYTTQMILKLIPQEALYTFTAASPKSLIYSKENFIHKIIVIPEANQLNGADTNDVMTMIIRSLQSEGCIEYDVTVKDSKTGQYITQTIKKDGPTGLLLTTTAKNIHPENETRMLSVYADESIEQTRKILKRTAELQVNPKGKEHFKESLQEWIMFQQWLSYQSFDIAIPFMPAVIEGMKYASTRYRRDINMIISLIKTSALIHQVNRETDEQGRITATLDDYENIRDLINPAMTRDATTKIASIQKKLLTFIYKKISRYDNDEGGVYKVSSQQLADEMGIPKSTVQDNINTMIEDSYLANAQEKRNSPMLLTLGSSFDTELIGKNSSLPSRQCLEEQISKGMNIKKKQ